MNLIIKENPENAPFIVVCASFAIAAGGLEILASLRFFPDQSMPTQLIYIATDLCLLLGYLSWHLHQHNNVGGIGLVGFLCAFLGTAFIAGPSAHLGGVAAYTIGSPLVGLGTFIMVVSSWRHGTLPKYVLMSYCIALVFILLTPFFPLLYHPVAILNCVFGIAFVLLGLHLVSVHKPLRQQQS